MRAQEYLTAICTYTCTHICAYKLIHMCSFRSASSTRKQIYVLEHNKFYVDMYVCLLKMFQVRNFTGNNASANRQLCTFTLLTFCLLKLNFIWLHFHFTLKPNIFLSFYAVYYYFFFRSTAKVISSFSYHYLTTYSSCHCLSWLPSVDKSFYLFFAFFSFVFQSFHSLLCLHISIKITKFLWILFQLCFGFVGTFWWRIPLKFFIFFYF